MTWLIMSDKMKFTFKCINKHRKSDKNGWLYLWQTLKYTHRNAVDVHRVCNGTYVRNVNNFCFIFLLSKQKQKLNAQNKTRFTCTFNTLRFHRVWEYRENAVYTQKNELVSLLLLLVKLCSLIISYWSRIHKQKTL